MHAEPQGESIWQDGAHYLLCIPASVGGPLYVTAGGVDGDSITAQPYDSESPQRQQVSFLLSDYRPI